MDILQMKRNAKNDFSKQLGVAYRWIIVSNVFLDLCIGLHPQLFFGTETPPPPTSKQNFSILFTKSLL